MRYVPLLFLAGCTSTAEVRVTSDPAGARLIVTQTPLDPSQLTEDVEPKFPPDACYYSLRTPATFRLDLSLPWTLYAAKRGYSTGQFGVDPSKTEYHFTLEKKP